MRTQSFSSALPCAVLPEPELGCPASLEPRAANAVRQAIKLAFVDSFRLIACIAAARSWRSASIAAVLLKGPSPDGGQVQ